jgi:organic radical activating enzyme
MNIRAGLFKLWLKVANRRGLWLTISITMRCPNKCGYCPCGQPPPKIQESTLEEWKDFIENFPTHISYVCISGGEPSLVEWFPDFVNWLIESGRTVTIYTMLQKSEQFLKIKKSWRLSIDATAHHGSNLAKFTKSYKQLLKDGYNIEAFELDNESSVLEFTKSKKFYSQRDIRGTTLFHCSPDAPKTKIIYRGSEWLYINSLDIDKN